MLFGSVSSTSRTSGELTNKRRASKLMEEGQAALITYEWILQLVSVK